MIAESHHLTKFSSKQKRINSVILIKKNYKKHQIPKKSNSDGVVDRSNKKNHFHKSGHTIRCNYQKREKKNKNSTSDSTN